MHVFKYSPRKGTKAATMVGQVDGKTKDIRSDILLKLSKENQKKYHNKYLGQTVEVLFEEPQNEYINGHTRNYMMVTVGSGVVNANDIKLININGVTQDRLLGEF